MVVIAFAALIALASLGALLWAVHLGWLARMKSGFLITLVLAVAGKRLPIAASLLKYDTHSTLIRLASRVIRSVF